jgi:NADPH:quinone reductase
MRAVTLTGFDARPVLRDDLPEPSVADDGLLVRVRASSANPVDNAIAAGMLKGMVEHEFPVVLGRDYAGVVEEVGAAVSGYSAGDEVFGYVPHADPAVRDGSWAERIAVREDRVARAPGGVAVETAGAAALVGITAMVAFDALALAPGDKVLVVGATGGVGSVAVQLAARAGATVLAPALPEDEDYLRDLGVSEVLDRRAGTAPDGIDALLDLVSYGQDGFEAFAAGLKEGGRGVSPIGAAGDGPGRSNVMATATTENLERLGRLLQDGVRIPIQRSYELAEAGDALQALAGSHKHGKLAVRVG